MGQRAASTAPNSKASPQTTHATLSAGAREFAQGSQTGILLRRTRAWAQIRQSEGIRTAAAESMAMRRERRAASNHMRVGSPSRRTATPAGTRSPVLLKTTLQVPGTSAEANVTGLANPAIKDGRLSTTTV